MRYHGIETDSMLNGSGLRVCLWCSGCEHHCDSCQNPQTWNENSGKEFDIEAEEELFQELEKDYISGITFTGGDPLHNNNLEVVKHLCFKIHEEYPDKTIWIYSGYLWEDIWEEDKKDRLHKDKNKLNRRAILATAEAFVDGKFEKDKADVSYHWAGSTNQRVIDCQKSIWQNKIVLWEDQVRNKWR